MARRASQPIRSPSHAAYTGTDCTGDSSQGNQRFENPSQCCHDSGRDSQRPDAPASLGVEVWSPRCATSRDGGSNQGERGHIHRRNSMHFLSLADAKDSCYALSENSRSCGAVSHARFGGTMGFGPGLMGVKAHDTPPMTGCRAVPSVRSMMLERCTVAWAPPRTRRGVHCQLTGNRRCDAKCK